MNHVVLIGNLTGDPDVRQVQEGLVKCVFRIGVQRDYKSAKTGKREADFITVVCWRGLAESCGKFLKKGRQVCVRGSLQTRSYLDGEERRYVTEVAAEQVEFLYRKPRDGEEQEGAMDSVLPEEPEDYGYIQTGDEKLPF